MVSIIIILEVEQRRFVSYIKTIDRILTQSGLSHEFIIVANGTGKFIRPCLDSIQKLNDRMRVFEFRVRTSKADCIRTIAKEIHGDWLLICGSHQELSEESMQKLISEADAAVDVVIPWRRKGAKRISNQVYAHIFNWFVGRLTKNDFHDITCSIKMCRRAILEEIEYFGDVLRFLPIFAAAKGYKIKEVPVEGILNATQKRFFHKPTVYINRVIEIFALFFNTHFSSKPLRFFSAVGTLFSFAGLTWLIVLFVQRFFFDISIGNRPSLFVSLLLMILGILVSSAGLLGEIIVFSNRRSRKEYNVEKMLP